MESQSLLGAIDDEFNFLRVAPPFYYEDSASNISSTLNHRFIMAITSSLNLHYQSTVTLAPSNLTSSLPRSELGESTESHLSPPPGITKASLLHPTLKRSHSLPATATLIFTSMKLAKRSCSVSWPMMFDFLTSEEHISSSVFTIEAISLLSKYGVEDEHVQFQRLTLHIQQKLLIDAPKCSPPRTSVKLCFEDKTFRLCYHLQHQSWYVLNHLVSFGSSSVLKNVQVVWNMLSSLIRSIGILIGTPHSSLSVSDGWSLRRDVFRGVLEPHAIFKISCIRVIVVKVDSLIRSIGILVGIHHDPCSLSISWDLWVNLKLGGLGSKIVLLSPAHLIVSRFYIASIKLASSLDVIFPIRESTTFLGLVPWTLLPVRLTTVGRPHPLYEEFQTAVKRNLIGFSKAVIFRSTSEKCEKFYFAHLDPIEDNLGEYHRRTMSFGDLSFYISCIFVVCLTFCTFMVLFEDAIKVDVMNM